MKQFVLVLCFITDARYGGFPGGGGDGVRVRPTEASGYDYGKGAPGEVIIHF